MAKVNAHNHTQASSCWQQSVVNSLDAGVVVLDRQYHIVDINHFIVSHCNRNKPELLGKSIFDAFSELDQDWFLNKCEPAFMVNTPMFILWEQRPFLLKFPSARPITAGATDMYQNVTIYPVQHENGDVDKLCILIHDVTDQAIQKQQLNKLNKELETVSRTDGMTGLFNRRYWQERYDRDFKLAHRSQNTPSTVMILDIDFFKKVNDQYGHQAGDEVIKALSGIIQVTMRTTDVIGRYGGEEFVVLLPNTDLTNAKIVAERLRVSSEKATVTHEGKDIKFTISIGMSEFSTGYGNSMEWLEDADQALYTAKHDGRNKTCLAPIKSASVSDK